MESKNPNYLDLSKEKYPGQTEPQQEVGENVENFAFALLMPAVAKLEEFNKLIDEGKGDEALKDLAFGTCFGTIYNTINARPNTDTITGPDNRLHEALFDTHKAIRIADQVKDPELWQQSMRILNGLVEPKDRHNEHLQQQQNDSYKLLKNNIDFLCAEIRRRHEQQVANAA